MHRVNKIVRRYHEKGRDAAIQLLLMPSYHREMGNLPSEIRNDVEGEVWSKLAQGRKRKERLRENRRRKRDEQVTAIVRRIREGQDVSRRLYYAHPTVRDSVMQQVPEHREHLDGALDRQHRIASLNGETPYQYCNDKFSQPHPIADALNEVAWLILKNSGGDECAAAAAWNAGLKAAIAGGDVDEVLQAAWDAGEKLVMDMAKIGDIGERREYTATVRGFGTQKSGYRGRYVTPIIRLADITHNGDRIGNQWFRQGKVWEGLKSGDKVSFRASSDGSRLIRPTKVRLETERDARFAA